MYFWKFNFSGMGVQTKKWLDVEDFLIMRHLFSRTMKGVIADTRIKKQMY